MRYCDARGPAPQLTYFFTFGDASGASGRVERASFRHCDPEHLETQLRRSAATTKIIVTDGVFSQDGDIAPLPAYLALAERYDDEGNRVTP